VKSDRSVVGLHHFGLGLRHFWWKASRVHTSADSKVQVSAAYSNTDETSFWHIAYGAWCRVSGACRSISVLETSCETGKADTAC